MDADCLRWTTAPTLAYRARRELIQQRLPRPSSRGRQQESQGYSFPPLPLNRAVGSPLLLKLRRELLHWQLQKKAVAPAGRRQPSGKQQNKCLLYFCDSKALSSFLPWENTETHRHTKAYL